MQLVSSPALDTGHDSVARRAVKISLPDFGRWGYRMQQIMPDKVRNRARRASRIQVGSTLTILH